MEAKQIVIVEDDEVTALNLKMNIEKLGYHVSGDFRNARDLLDTISQIPVDLFFIDISLEAAADGLELARELKEKTGKPFIFLTAHSDENVVAKAKALDPSGYIVKPFHPNSLKASLQMALPKQKEAHHSDNIATLPKSAVSSRLKLLAQAGTLPFAHLYRYSIEQDRFYKNNTPIDLEMEHKELLKLLLANLGVVLTHEEIQEYFQNSFEKMIKVGRVIMRLKMFFGSEVIKSAAGIGYYIEE